MISLQKNITKKLLETAFVIPAVFNIVNGIVFSESNTYFDLLNQKSIISSITEQQKINLRQ